MTTVYMPDPVRVMLAPFDMEIAAAEAHGAEFILGDPDNPVIRDAEIILTTRSAFPAEVIRTLKRCRLIARYAVGVDAIDLEAATECGIVVTNAPTYCIEEVADHAAALTLSMARRIPWFSQQLHAGRWRETHRDLWNLRRISSLTLGVVGVGKIGSRFVQRMRGFGCRILGNDINVSDEVLRSYGVIPASLEQILRESDLLSLHVPLTPQNRHMIGAEQLAMMKPTAAIINTSRGAVIDEAALIDALKSNRIMGVALDVLEQEPPPPDHPLLGMDPMRVILTPHYAASSYEVYPTLHQEVTDAMVAVLENRWPKSVMNPDVKPKVPLMR
jgi:D-3-phosphoglycerate dehydrogenase